MGKPISGSIVTLTPRMAKELLEVIEGSDQDNYRQLNQRRAAAMAGDIKAGRWEINGSAIVVDGSGRMLDGQHRCQAVVLAGQPIRTMLVTGVEKSAEETLDTGKTRLFSDLLRNRGEPYSTQLAAAVRRVWSYQRGTLAGGGRVGATSRELLAVLKRHGRVREWISIVGSSRHRVITPGILGFVAYMGQRRGGITDEATLEFVDGVMSGVDLKGDDPRLVLRTAILGQKGRKSSDPLYWGNHQVLASTIKAWNQYLMGNAVKLRTIRYASLSEKYPAFLTEREVPA